MNTSLLFTLLFTYALIIIGSFAIPKDLYPKSDEGEKVGGSFLKKLLLIGCGVAIAIIIIIDYFFIK